MAIADDEDEVMTAVQIRQFVAAMVYGNIGNPEGVVNAIVKQWITDQEETSNAAFQRGIDACSWGH